MHKTESIAVTYLVQVGEMVNPGRQGFSTRKNWNETVIHEINRATYHLAERNRIESLESFAQRNGLCNVKTNATIQWSTLKVFFYSDFGMCGLIFLYDLFEWRVRKRRND